MNALVCSLILALSPPTGDTVDASEPVDDAADAAVDADTTEVVHLESRVAASPGTGAASNIKGRFRIHLDGNLFAFQHERDWFESDVPNDQIEDVRNRVGFGVGQYNFGLGLGYGITDGLIVGMKLGIGFNSTTQIDKDPLFNGPDAINNSLNFLVRPYVEYAFIPGGRFRPFVFVHGGVAGSRSVTTDSDNSAALIAHTIAPTLGGGGGLHIFVIPQLSIDVFGEVDHSFVLSKSRLEIDGVLDPNDNDIDYNRNNQVTEFSVLAGLSLWFGGA